MDEHRKGHDFGACRTDSTLGDFWLTWAKLQINFGCLATEVHFQRMSSKHTQGLILLDLICTWEWKL